MWFCIPFDTRHQESKNLGTWKYNKWSKKSRNVSSWCARRISDDLHDHDNDMMTLVLEAMMDIIILPETYLLKYVFKIILCDILSFSQEPVNLACGWNLWGSITLSSVIVENIHPKQCHIYKRLYRPRKMKKDTRISFKGFEDIKIHGY